MGKRKNTNRRPQAVKGENKEYIAAMMEIRRSNAAAPRPLATDYRRKPKHVNQGWDI